MQSREILLTLQTNDVIFLTGTKRPRTQCSPLTHSVLAGYRLFEWGQRDGTGGRIDTRGSLLPSRLTFAKSGKSAKWASPDASVQGAIRIKKGEARSFADGALPSTNG